jgi:hypothetical protein
VRPCAVHRINSHFGEAEGLLQRGVHTNGKKHTPIVSPAPLRREAQPPAVSNMAAQPPAVSNTAACCFRMVQHLVRLGG